MGPLIKADLMISGICLSLAFLHLAIYVRRPELKAYLFFAIMCFCMAGSAYFETGAYCAATSGEFLSAFKILVTLQGILWISFAWFVAFYTGFSRKWLAITVTGLYAVAVVINLISPYGVLYSGIEKFYQITLPWGEHIAYVKGPSNSFRIIPDIAWFLLIYFTIESLIRLGRAGQKRRAVYLGVVFFVFIGIEYLHGTLIDFGIMNPPSLFSVMFLGLILVMSAMLVSEVVRASQLSREIASNERRWRTLLENVKLLVAGLDRDGKVNYVNPYFCDISGYAADEILGKYFTDLTPEKDRPVLIEQFTKAIQGEILPRSEVPFMTKYGSVRHMVWSNALLRDTDNQMNGILSIGEDVTELRQTELDRNRAMKELETIKNQLEEENIYLKTEIRDAHLFSDIIGKSNALLYVLNRIEQVSRTDATVLVMGETGAGKELISQAIHEKSKRGEKPFIKVNCAVFPENLVESELFGHERGAFTGAEQLRKGRFELADGGTMFLDEISELSLKTQTKFLRVLQDGEFERVGGSQTLKVDVRVICATNHDLDQEISMGRFRADLFYRLNVYPITVPPLRKRQEDIPLLVEYFVPQIASRIGKHIDQVSPHMMEQFMAYDWPGNVRELKNVIERAIITTPDSTLRLSSGFNEKKSKQPAESMDNTEHLSTLEDVERRYILTVLKATNWRISGPKGAAKILGLNPSTLRFRIKKHGIIRKN